MAVDKRTFYIVVAIVVITLPIIILVFHKSFFPLLVSVVNTFISAALTSSTTGVPQAIMKLFH